MEKASEFGVSKALSAGNSDLFRLWGQNIDLETSEQIEDPDEVYAEGERLRFSASRLTILWSTTYYSITCNEFLC